MWYRYRQNNSGGRFIINDDVAVTVFVEALSASDANEWAERVGLYFDGHNDCPCCGNRWYSADDEYDGAGEPEPPSDFLGPKHERVTGTWAWFETKPDSWDHCDADFNTRNHYAISYDLNGTKRYGVAQWPSV